MAAVSIASISNKNKEQKDINCVTTCEIKNEQCTNNIVPIMSPVCRSQKLVFDIRHTEITFLRFLPYFKSTGHIHIYARCNCLRMSLNYYTIVTRRYTNMVQTPQLL